MEKDCFAYKSPKKCNALTHNFDCGPDCPFYKSKMDFIVSRMKVYWRLARLPEEAQCHIAETYYDGKRLWLTASKGIRK